MRYFIKFDFESFDDAYQCHANGAGGFESIGDAVVDGIEDGRDEHAFVVFYIDPAKRFRMAYVYKPAMIAIAS